MDRLLELQLVSKVCKELETHVGSGDKSLAEFVIHLARDESKSADDFYNRLLDNDAELPRDFVETLFSMIHRMSSSRPSSQGSSDKFASAGKYSTSTLAKSEEKTETSASGQVMTLSADTINNSLHSLDRSIKEEMEQNLRKKIEMTRKFPGLCMPNNAKETEVVKSEGDRRTVYRDDRSFDKQDSNQIQGSHQ